MFGEAAGRVGIRVIFAWRPVLAATRVDRRGSWFGRPSESRPANDLRNLLLAICAWRQFPFSSRNPAGAPHDRAYRLVPTQTECLVPGQSHITFSTPLLANLGRPRHGRQPQSLS